MIPLTLSAGSGGFIQKLFNLFNVVTNKNIKEFLFRIGYASQLFTQNKINIDILLAKEIQPMLLSDEYELSFFWSALNNNFSGNLTIENEIVLNKIGMRESLNFSIFGFTDKLKVVQSIESSLIQHPEYSGLLRILTEYVIVGIKTKNFCFKDFPTYDDTIDQGNILLLRFASNQLDGMSPNEFVSEILGNHSENNNLLERLAELLRNHEIAGQWIEDMLVILDSHIPASAYKTQQMIQEYLRSLYQKHTSCLEQFERQTKLELPLVSLTN